MVYQISDDFFPCMYNGKYDIRLMLCWFAFLFLFFLFFEGGGGCLFFC